MISDVKKEKARLRNEILGRRDALDINVRTEKSECIISRLLNLPMLCSAEHVFIYVSYNSEVVTHGLINMLLSRRKTVSVPYIDPSEHRMYPAVIHAFPQGLTVNRYGILEPDPDHVERASADTIDLVVVPGTVFSESGYRIGYGGGYYDRFLRNCAVASCGLSFDCQVLEEVPCDPARDVPVDCVLTETRLIRCR